MKKHILLVLLLFGLGSFHSAKAETITKSMWFNYLYYPKDFLFDTSLGTLTSVELDIQGDTRVVYESGDDPPWGNVSDTLYTTVWVDIGVSGSSSRTIYFSELWGDGQVESDSGDPYAYGDAFFFGGDYLTDPSTLSDFTLQPGDEEVRSDAMLSYVEPYFLTDDLGKTYEIWDVDTLGEIQVTYTYTPVPISGAGWLLGSGLIGLVAVRRRKKG